MRVEISKLDPLGPHVVGRQVDVDVMRDEVIRVEPEVDGGAGDGEDREGRAEGLLLLAVGLGELDGKVLELAVLHDEADGRLVDLDLINDELAGEEREDPGACADAIAREGRPLAVARVERHFRKLEGERDELDLDRVRRVKALLREEPPRLLAAQALSIEERARTVTAMGRIPTTAKITHKRRAKNARPVGRSPPAGGRRGAVLALECIGEG